MLRLGVQLYNVKSMNCPYGIVSSTRSSPIRLPVRERTYYDIETLLRSFFGSQWVDYAPLTLLQKYGIESDLGTFHAGSSLDTFTLKLKSCSLRNLSPGNPTPAKPIGLRCTRHHGKDLNYSHSHI